LGAEGGVTSFVWVDFQLRVIFQLFSGLRSRRCKADHRFEVLRVLLGVSMEEQVRFLILNPLIKSSIHLFNDRLKFPND
jgi:hypothetical protein